VAHPFNPPHLVPLVEVVAGRQTSEAAVDSALEVFKHLGKRPIRIRRELPGHVANRLQAALWREAYHLVSEGVASVEDVDIAISAGPGLRWALLGPFATQHLSGGDGGLEHVLAHLGPPMVDWWNDLGNPELTPELIATLVAQAKKKDYSGYIFDIENISPSSIALYPALIARARAALKPLGREVWVTAPFDDDDWPLKALQANSDSLMLMAYDEHWLTGKAGPTAGEDWFEKYLNSRLSMLDPNHTIVAFGAYGYGDLKVYVPPLRQAQGRLFAVRLRRMGHPLIFWLEKSR